jgi:hypothetical protein
MPLRVLIDINGDVISTLTIERKLGSGAEIFPDLAKGEGAYYYDYRGARGTSTGYIRHRVNDGALTLATKVLTDIDKYLGRLL